MWDFDFEQRFDYENGFYLTAPVNRISKFVCHLDLFRRISELPGEVVECGVFKGPSLSRWIKFRALLENAFSRRVIGFDTFGAFPETSFVPDQAEREKFIQEAGGNSITVERMRESLAKWGLDQNVELVAGDILQTLPAYLESHPELRIALLHVDVDLYEPTQCCLSRLWQHVVPGGIVILDDYGAFAGANKAIEEQFTGTGVKIQKLPYANAVAYVEKPR